MGRICGRIFGRIFGRVCCWISGFAHCALLAQQGEYFPARRAQ